MRIFINSTLSNYNVNNQVKKDEIGRACSTNGVKTNAYRILVRKSEEKRWLGRRRHTWVNNIKRILEIEGGDTDWIDLAQTRD
jgi:hypothetical protein